MRRTLDGVLKEAAEVERRLGELDPEAFVDRIEARDRLLDLRAEIGRLREGSDAEGPTDRLLAQLESLRRERKRLRKQRIDVVKQGVETRIYQQVEAGLGIADVDEQIERIESILDHRGVQAN